MDWNDYTIAQLRILWNEGHSTAEIGRRMGCSKNAVVGKARRTGLDERLSPINRDPTRPYQPRIRRARGATLPALSSIPAIDPYAAVSAEIAAQKRATRSPRRVAQPVLVDPVFRQCCWPVGEPGQPSFHFCDARAAVGRPYCEQHCEVAYIRFPSRQETETAA